MIYEIYDFLRNMEDPRLVDVYRTADDIMFEQRDTLSDEFQLSATICSAINRRVGEMIEGRK